MQSCHHDLPVIKKIKKLIPHQFFFRQKPFDLSNILMKILKKNQNSIGYGHILEFRWYFKDFKTDFEKALLLKIN